MVDIAATDGNTSFPADFFADDDIILSSEEIDPFSSHSYDEKELLLAYPINIDAVLKHLHCDMRDDWLTDPLQHKDLYSNKEDLRKVLHELLLQDNGRYLGALRSIYDIPKKGFGVRYALETDFYDRFIYQSTCSYLLPFFDPLLSHRVLGHRYDRYRSSERYLFKERIELWHTFEGVTKTALRNQQALLVTDVINYFENISVELVRQSFEKLLPQVSASGPEKALIRNAISTLCELLTRWCFSGTHGLPQNRDASSFIANIVLNSVDQQMTQSGYDYYRYVDDIRIICDAPRQAKRALTTLIGQLRLVGMNINTAKTVILTNQSSNEEIFQHFPSADDRSRTIDNMWKSGSRRVIARSAKYIYELLRDCVQTKQSQSRQFRFGVNRLIRLTEANLFDVHSALSTELKALLIDSLEDHAASTDQYCRLISILSPSADELDAICRHLCDNERSIYSWQNFQLWLLLASLKHKNDELLSLAKTRLQGDLKEPEVASIFIYLRCIDCTNELLPLIAQFSRDWPYTHQRNFLLAVSELDEETLKPLISQLGPKLKRTISRAKPHFKDGPPLLKPDPTPLTALYRSISPYD